MSYSSHLGALLPTTVMMPGATVSALVPGVSAAVRQAARAFDFKTPPIAATSRRGADAANPQDTGDIVPAECESLAFYAAPPTTIQPGQILVVAYPYVLGDPAAMPLILAEILGAQGQGGNTLVRFVGANPNAFSFVGGGWMRDAKSLQSVTKGTLYLALSPQAPTSRAMLERSAELLLMSAIEARGTRVTRSDSSRLGPKINLLTRWSTLAQGESDDELRQAAYTSAGAAGQFGSFIRVALQQAPAIARQGARLSSEFTSVAAQLTGAQRVATTADQIAAAADGAIETALAMPREQGAQAIALLDGVRGQLQMAQNLLRTGTAAAPAFLQSAGEQRGAILVAVRGSILASAETAISRGSPLELGREFYRCALLKQAKRSVESALGTVVGALDAGAAAALWLMNNAPLIDSATKKLADALGRVETAIEQIPMGWLLRTRLGLPTWAWFGIGGVAFVGGAFGLRAIKKKRQKAVSPNRRRRNRRVRRTSR
jgi:hypothetical protein